MKTLMIYTAAAAKVRTPFCRNSNSTPQCPQSKPEENPHRRHYVHFIKYHKSKKTQKRKGIRQK
jgi:hypothetical protein